MRQSSLIGRAARAAVIVAGAGWFTPASAVVAGSVSGADTAVSFTLPYGDGSVRIPLAGNVLGQAFGEVAAGSTGVSALLTEATPSAGPGAILTAGPPPVGGSVGYAAVTKTHSNLAGSAAATSRATIRASPSGPGGGVVNQVTVVGATPTSASTTGIAFAVGTANVDTDPIVLAPLAAAQPLTLVVDLFAAGEAESPGGLRLTASGSGGPTAFATVAIHATTNIAGLESLFDLTLEARHDSSAIVVGFTSPVMSSPLTALDFVGLGGGVSALKGDKAVFAVPFTVPAGTLGVVDGEPVGLVLNVALASSAQAAAVSEPGSAALLLAGLVGLAALSARAAGRARRPSAAPSPGAAPSIPAG